MEEFGADTILKAFVQSRPGKALWVTHDNGTKIAESQSEITPLQRNFIVMAADEYGPDKSDIPRNV